MNAPSASGRTVRMGDTFRFGQEEFRIVGGAVESRPRSKRPAEPWGARSKRSLLEYDTTSSLWDWLRSQGIRRPAPSGPSGPSKPRKERSGVGLEVRLSDAAGAALDRLVSRYGTRTAAVEAALLALDASG